LPALRYAVRVNGIDGLALTKLDVLTGLPEIKVCVAYRTPRGLTEDFPIDELDVATPVYESVAGWSADIGGARALDDLPEPARKYVERIERDMSCPAIVVSVGSRRDQTIAVRDPFEA
jgi:adenylosuccinate synthase